MSHFYLIHIQYLGFRFHGWMKQTGLKTVHGMIDKTMWHVLQHHNFRTLGCSRTDAMVSSNQSAFELFVKESLDTDQLLLDINSNLPPDIRATKIESVDKKFNIINDVKMKEYLYLFCFGEKPHPFTAPLMMSFEELLNIERMQQGALLFEGQHNFIRYCTKPSVNTIFERNIIVSRIEENQVYQANFFPKKSYLYRIMSKGFMRYQIRLMMGQLIRLGKGEITLDDIETSLNGQSADPMRFIAPASGLILNTIEFNK